MKSAILINSPDVVLMYQDYTSVEPAIQQIKELKLKFKIYKYDPNRVHEIAAMKPKVLLLSSNNIKNTIRLYVDYLEQYEQNIAPHKAVLLIKSGETFRAYLACENALFDDYAIVNPLNEPYRLKLILLQALKIIEDHKNDGLEKLIAEGEDELASCIEHGVALKKSFIHEIAKCEEGILLATDNVLGNTEAKTVLQNMIGLTLEEMNENVSVNIQGILDQLIELKINSQAVAEDIEKHRGLKNNTIHGINTDLLISAQETKKNPLTSRYKILIAEPSDLFTRAILEIFSATAFDYLTVNNGPDTLTQIAAFKPDVVLMAYDLPKMNGVDITKTLRAEGNTVPIVAYTQHRDQNVIKRWIPFGLSGYLIKPSKKSAILSSVTNAIKNPIDVIKHHSSADQSYIVWGEEYSVGNKAMDEQHKALFDLINEFFHQEDKHSTVMFFQHLLSYIDLHFEAEENLLREMGYPKTEEHIKKHNELREKFHLLQEKLENYSVDIHHKIALFLYNWLTKHILKSDMDYKAYALSIGYPSFH